MNIELLRIPTDEDWKLCRMAALNTIERYEDGYVLCPILWTGGKCEECMEVFERRQERYD